MTPRTPTPTLITALRIIARDIQSGDGVANAAIAEAADRLEEMLGESREFQGWSIFWKWEDGGEVPVYKKIGNGFPWFRTKREAIDFLRSIGVKYPSSGVCPRWEIKRVSLAMSWSPTDSGSKKSAP